eukprot:scaffold139465_cov84-Phaeocystis_antarctica.AAC.1
MHNGGVWAWCGGYLGGGVCGGCLVVWCGSWKCVLWWCVLWRVFWGWWCVLCGRALLLPSQALLPFSPPFPRDLPIVLLCSPRRAAPPP